MWFTCYVQKKLYEGWGWKWEKFKAKTYKLEFLSYEGFHQTPQMQL
jgi:hypothetical protein